MATLWTEDLHPIVKQHEELGNKRVVVKTLEYISTCINVYMPSGNTIDKKKEYHETLDILRQAALQFIQSYTVVITGDINMDLSKEKYNTDKRRQSLPDMIRDLNMEVMSNFTKPTAYLHGDKGQT